MQVRYRTTEEIEAGLVDVLASPRDRGKVELIIIRPADDQRELREAVYLSPEGGVEGDRWVKVNGKLDVDGDPEARAQQVSLMNARLLRLIAGDEERMALAGDNLIVDFDLSEANLPAGQKLAIGEALIQISDQSHTGCGKFNERFGSQALRFINAKERRPLRLRGLYARVLQAGHVRVGDIVRKVD
jgi:MOSC domain-containing protein YiiM